MRFKLTLRKALEIAGTMSFASDPHSAYNLERSINATMSHHPFRAHVQEIGEELSFEQRITDLARENGWVSGDVEEWLAIQLKGR